MHLPPLPCSPPARRPSCVRAAGARRGGGQRRQQPCRPGLPVPGRAGIKLAAPRVPRGPRFWMILWRGGLCTLQPAVPPCWRRTHHGKEAVCPPRALIFRWRGGHTRRRRDAGCGVSVGRCSGAKPEPASCRPPSLWEGCIGKWACRQTFFILSKAGGLT